MTSRYYKARAAIVGTDPEYTDCKAEVNGNAAKYTYTSLDYPCAKPRELEAYTTQNVQNNISDCYQDLLAHRITHASKHEKLKLGDVGLALSIPGFIDKAGETTFYNVNKDCSITVTKVSSYTGLILKQEIMSRGAFNTKYKIDDSVTPPAPAPTPDTGGGDDFLDNITGKLEDLLNGAIDNITKPPYVYGVAAVGGFVVLKMLRIIR